MSTSKKINIQRPPSRTWLQVLCCHFCLAWSLLIPMSNTSFAQTIAADPVASAESTSAQTTCFDSIWEMAHDHPWYRDAEGRQIVPEVAQDWLIVKFREPGATHQQVEGFYNRYREAFDGLAGTLDAGESAAAYQLRQGLPYGLFDALLQRWQNDPQVHSIQPAWRIEQELYAPLDKIEIEWKTASNQQTRQRLLEEAEALPKVIAKGPNTDVVTINPCRRLAWQTAALLGDDLYVTRAVPLKRPLTPPVAIQFLLDRPGAIVGTPMPFSLEILFTEGIKIDAATIANLNLNPRGIFHNLYEISFDHPLSTVDLSRSPIRITGTLRIYANGDYQLPALPVYFSDSRTGDSRPATIRTANIPIRIASMIPEGEEDYRLQIAAPVPLPGVIDPEQSSRFQKAVTLSATGLLLLILGMIAWLRIPSQPAQKAEQIDQARLRKHHTDLAEKLKSDPLSLQLDDWAELGGSLQALLAEYAGLPPATSGGSHSSFLSRLKGNFSNDEIRQAEAVLKGIEHLLCAERPDDEQRCTLLAQAEKLVTKLADRTPGWQTDKGAC